ncbi:MAG: nickel pincer cofactor biosynthesis protein LarB, partial [Nitrospira sp.]|nr:nickel pincer cofactor biosynthesis protein LarB [Nitrospira sp.]
MLRYHELAKTATLEQAPIVPLGKRPIALICAGTGDIPVAEECAETLRLLGIQIERLYDVGVAGIHRLLSRREIFERTAMAIVVAGMEGALPSVVGGLVSIPVIAVPTSVGYGASFGGVTALACMLTSCASGITVCNIDNGFGAAFAAARIFRTAHE